MFGCFSDDEFDEDEFERQLEAEPSLGIAACMYWIRKLQARVFAEDYAAAAVAAAKKAEGSSGCRQPSSSGLTTISCMLWR